MEGVGLGMGKAEMSAKAAAKLWEVIVMPVLEYGGELERGRWDEAERLQIFRENGAWGRKFGGG